MTFDWNYYESELASPVLEDLAKRVGEVDTDGDLVPGTGYAPPVPLFDQDAPAPPVGPPAAPPSPAPSPGPPLPPAAALGDPGRSYRPGGWGQQSYGYYAPMHSNLGEGRRTPPVSPLDNAVRLSGSAAAKPTRRTKPKPAAFVKGMQGGGRQPDPNYGNGEDSNLYITAEDFPLTNKEIVQMVLIIALMCLLFLGLYGLGVVLELMP